MASRHRLAEVDRTIKLRSTAGTAVHRARDGTLTGLERRRLFVDRRHTSESIAASNGSRPVGVDRGYAPEHSASVYATGHESSTRRYLLHIQRPRRHAGQSRIGATSAFSHFRQDVLAHAIPAAAAGGAAAHRHHPRRPPLPPRRWRAGYLLALSTAELRGCRRAGCCARSIALSLEREPGSGLETSAETVDLSAASGGSGLLRTWRRDCGCEAAVIRSSSHGRDWAHATGSDGCRQLQGLSAGDALTLAEGRGRCQRVRLEHDGRGWVGRTEPVASTDQHDPRGSATQRSQPGLPGADRRRRSSASQITGVEVAHSGMHHIS